MLSLYRVWTTLEEFRENKLKPYTWYVEREDALISLEQPDIILYNLYGEDEDISGYPWEFVNRFRPMDYTPGFITSGPGFEADIGLLHFKWSLTIHDSKSESWKWERFSDAYELLPPKFRLPLRENLLACLKKATEESDKRYSFYKGSLAREISIGRALHNMKER